LEIPKGKNLFVDLVERITHCWVCGNTQMREGISLKLLELLRWKQSKPELQSVRIRKQEQWNLKNKVIGEECILRKGKAFNTAVGNMACKQYLVIKNTITRWVPREPMKYWSVEKKAQGCL
ncbi:ENR1 protein, partial [Horornis vulcanius]|nr:ENR1 protein [Horornis vulcanius]